MSYFVITYTHPDMDGWKKYLSAHIAYLDLLLKEERLIASGPFVHTPEKSAMLILKVQNKEEALSVVAKDPYTIHGLIGELTVSEWNPVFGEYQSFANRILSGLRKIFKGSL